MAPKWLPAAVTAIVSFGIFYGMSPIISVSSLVLACEELNLPSNCNDKAATSIVANFNLVMSLLVGIMMIITAGAWAAAASRLGRRITAISSIFGYMIQSLAWTTVFFFPALRPHWKIIIAIGQASNAVCGHFPLLLISIYGQIGDITADSPELRSFLFTLLAGSIGGTGIIGYQLGQLINYVDKKFIFLGIFSGFFLIWLFVIFFLPETVADDVRAVPIDWKRAHVFGALSFWLPFKHTKKMLHDDAVKMYRIRLGETLDVEIPDDLELPLCGNEAVHVLMDEGILKPYDPHEIIEHQTSGGTDPDSYPIDTEDVPLVSSPSHIYSEMDLPNYIQHRNAIFIIGLAMSTSMMILIGMSSVFFNAFKQEFNMSSTFYSNLLTIQAGCKGVGTFVIVPLIKPILTTPNSELYVMSLTLLLEGLFVIGVGWFKSMPVVIVCCGLQAITAVLAGGFIRSLITNQVSINLQGMILSLTTALEVFTLLLAGFAANGIFSLTNSTQPRFVIMCFGFILVVASILPWLISDSADEFNRRCQRKHVVVEKSKSEKEPENPFEAALLEDSESVYFIPESADGKPIN